MKYKEHDDRDQESLFPKTIDDFIEQDHLARFVEFIVNELDFDELHKKFCSVGQRAYDPKMLTSLLFYGYSIGVYSSRKLEDACINRLDFRYLTCNLFPSYKSISEFRKINLAFLEKKFSEIVMIAVRMGAVNIGNIRIAIDGTKIKANASSKNTKNLEQLKKLKERADQEVEKLLKEAEHIDKQEDSEVKSEKKKKISKKVIKNIKKIEVLKEEILDLDKKIEEDLKEAEAVKGNQLTESEKVKIKNQKRNTTDHDAKFMKERNGCIRSSYNGQASVSEENQIILGVDVTTSASDQNQFINMVEKTEENINANVNNSNADAGYEKTENVAYRKEDENFSSNIDSARKNMIGTEKHKFNKVNFTYNNEDDTYKCLENGILPFYKKGVLKGKPIRKYRCENYATCPFREKCCKRKIKTINRYEDDYILEENYIKMSDPEVREEYSVRKYTVEPVFGTLKFNRKFLTFLLRGIDKVRSEFSILCSSFNIRKLHQISLNNYKY